MAKSMEKGGARSSARDAAQDKKLVKSGVGQHESKMHKGQPKTKLKLGKGA